MFASRVPQRMRENVVIAASGNLLVRIEAQEVRLICALVGLSRHRIDSAELAQKIPSRPSEMLIM
jgi:hypothetical protein